MERHGVRKVSEGEVAMPLIMWQRVEKLLEAIPDMQSVITRIDALEALQVTQSEYLTRNQAMTFLHVGSTKLWELASSGQIATSSGTGKKLYNVQSCKDFLRQTGYSSAQVQAQFQAVMQSKKKK